MVAKLLFFWNRDRSGRCVGYCRTRTCRGGNGSSSCRGGKGSSPSACPNRLLDPLRLRLPRKKQKQALDGTSLQLSARKQLIASTNRATLSLHLRREEKNKKLRARFQSNECLLATNVTQGVSASVTQLYQIRVCTRIAFRHLG